MHLDTCNATFLIAYGIWGSKQGMICPHPKEKERDPRTWIHPYFLNPLDPALLEPRHSKRFHDRGDSGGHFDKGILRKDPLEAVIQAKRACCMP